jgi:hypothetical protein
MIAVHARYGSEMHLHVRISSLHFSDKVHPEFCPPQSGLLLSYEGDVILLPAGHHTSLAARALIEIYHHSPSVHSGSLKGGIRISGYQEVVIRVPEG